MIDLRGVSKTVMSGSEPLTILHPLTMQIPRSQFIAIVGPSGRDVTSRVASLRQPGTTGLALVLDARSFGTTDADEAGPHVDSLRLAGWRAVSVQRDEDVAHAWAVLTAATVGGSR